MERIALATFDQALRTSPHNPKKNDDFKGVFSHDDKLEYYYQVDTKEFEYVYRNVPNTGNIYYTASR